jgi:YVTN family beta-propeller protein
MHRLPLAFLAAMLAAGAAPAHAQTAYFPTTNGTFATVDTKSFAIGSLATSVAFGTAVLVSPDGSTLYATTTDSAVAAINTVTGAVSAKIPFADQPAGLAISPDGTKLYVANTGTFSIPGNTVSVIDTATNGITATITVGNEPTGMVITPDGRKLYVANVFDNTLSIVDTAAGTVSLPLVTGEGIHFSTQGLSPDGTKLYVGMTPLNLPSSADPAIAAIDTRTDTVTALFDVGLLSNSRGFVGDALIAFTPDGRTAYAASKLSSRVPEPPDDFIEAIDSAVNLVARDIQLFSFATSITVTPDGKELFAPDDVTGLAILSTATDTFNPNGLTLTSLPNMLIGTMAIGATPSLVAAILPTGRSVETGTTATMFATVLNASSSSLQNCRIGLRGPVPAAVTVGYQTTDPVTNAVTGQQNQPVTIAGNGSQSFVLSVSSTTPLSLPAAPLLFLCDGLLPAPVITGVNTVDLAFSSTPIADVVALAATASNDGVVTVPQSQNADGAFAVASVNVGATDTLTVSADTGTAALPVSVTLCQTDPSTSQCLAPPAPTVTLSDAANATPTFSVFVNATAPIAFAPATARIFVRFKDAGGAPHGSTSVAVKTS